MSDVKVTAPEPEIHAEGTHAPPANRAEQIERLQAELRKVRFALAQLSERRQVLEGTLHRLLGERQAERLLEKLTPEQREALKRVQAE